MTSAPDGEMPLLLK